MISTWSLIFFTFKHLPPKNTFHCLCNNCCWRIPCVFGLIDDGKFSSGYFLLKGDSRPNDLVPQWGFVFCIVHIIIKLCWVRSVLQRYTRNTLFIKVCNGNKHLRERVKLEDTKDTHCKGNEKVSKIIHYDWFSI